MTKADLINAMVEKCGSENKLTKAHCKEMIDLMQSCMMDALVKGEEVSLAGFGTFKTSVREARVGRNPQTGEISKNPLDSLTSSKILPGIWLPGIPTKWQGDAPLVRGGFRRIK